MNALVEVARLATVSRLLWEAAVESAEAEGDVTRASAAEADGEAAGDSWQDALELLEAGDLAGAASALRDARWLAANWGDDGPEKHALAAIAQQAS